MSTKKIDANGRLPLDGLFIRPRTTASPRFIAGQHAHIIVIGVRATKPVPVLVLSSGVTEVAVQFLARDHELMFQKGEVAIVSTFLLIEDFSR